MHHPHTPLQGAGIGNIFKNIIRTTAPLVKKLYRSEAVRRGAKRALQIGKEEALKFADDVLQGGPASKSAKTRGKDALTRIISGKGKGKKGGAKKGGAKKGGAKKGGAKKGGGKKGGKKGGAKKGAKKMKSHCNKTIFD